jgi:hypothetical protein
MPEKDLLMQNGRFISVAWSVSAILISYHHRGEAVEQIALPHMMKADLRYFLKLYRMKDGSLLLRSGDSHGTCLDVARGAKHFQPIEDWPEPLSACPPYRVVPLHDGTVAGISPNPPQLMLWQPMNALRVYKLPEGFLLRDVEKDDHHRLWVCGTIPSQKLRSLNYRHALAMSNDDGISWQVQVVAPAGFKVAWQSVLSGAEATYRTICAVNDHLVLSAEAEDDDGMSTFLYVRDAQGKWQSGMLKNDILRAVLPAGHDELEIISHYGQAVSITARNKWRYQSLLPRIHHLIQGMDKRPPESARYEILDAQIAPVGKRIFVISIRVPEREQLARFGEAVVTLSELGDHLVAFHDQDDTEIITASYED